MMIAKKEWIGDYVRPQATIQYFLVQSGSYYGVELNEIAGKKSVSSLELFSEDYNETLAFVKKLCFYQVTPISLCEILDDYLAY